MLNLVELKTWHKSAKSCRTKYQILTLIALVDPMALVALIAQVAQGRTSMWKSLIWTFNRYCLHPFNIPANVNNFIP